MEWKEVQILFGSEEVEKWVGKMLMGWVRSWQCHQGSRYLSY